MRESRMADEWRLTKKTELGYEEALALKEEIRKREESRDKFVADLVHPAR
jgi:hypothetical protein